MTKKNIKEYVTTLKVGVIARYRGRVLLIRERNNRTHRYAWNIIKGTFEPYKDDSIFDTAIREAREEANAKIKLKYFLATYYLLDGRDALMMFTFVADLIDPRVQVSPQKLQAQYGNDNVIEVRLFTKQQLSRLKPKDFIGMRGYLATRDYLKGIKFPLNIVIILPPK